MSKTVANVAIATDTFAGWLGKTNIVLDTLTNYIVTTDFSAAGANTSGNSSIIGTLSANVLSAGVIRGGGIGNTANVSALTIGIANSTVSSNVTITGYVANVTANSLGISSNTTLTGANVYLNSTSVTVLGGALTVNSSASFTGNTLTSSANVNITAANVTITNASGNTVINAANTTISGGVLNISSNVSTTGATLTSSSNVNLTAANVTINNASGNVVVNAANATVSGGAFNISSNVSTTGSTLTSSANISLTAANVSISNASGNTKIAAANTTLSGGVVNISSNVSITSANVTVSSNVNFTGTLTTNNFVVTGNVFFNSEGLVFAGNNSGIFETSGNYLFPTNSSTANVVDSFLISDFKNAKYTVSARDNLNSNNMQITEISAVYGFSNVHSTEYGTIYSSTKYLTYTLSCNTTHVILSATSNASVTNAAITVVKTIFK